MKQAVSLSTGQKAAALLLSLLLVFSLLAPLGGLFNVVSAAEDNAAFYDDREYYVNLAVLATGSSSVTSTDYMAQFVNKQNNVQCQTTLTTAQNYSGQDASNILKIPSVGDGTGLNSAVRLIVRDKTVTNPSQNQSARAESAIRVIFLADSVESFERKEKAHYIAPALTALNAAGAAVSVPAGGNGTDSIAVTGTPLKKYASEKAGDYYYIDIDRKQFNEAHVTSFRFSCEEYILEEEDTVTSKRLTTVPLEILEHGGYVLYEGAIPRHPRIYEINAKVLAGNENNTSQIAQYKVELAQFTNPAGKYQNYFVLSDEEQFAPSKYFFPNIPTNLTSHSDFSLQRKIWVYNADWAGNGNIYAIEDKSEPVIIPVSLKEDPEMGKGWFVTQDGQNMAGKVNPCSGLIPGATYIFYPYLEDPTLDASAPTTFPLKGTNDAVFSEITEENYEQIKGQNFTPAYDDGTYNGTDSTSTVTMPDTVYYMSSSDSDKWRKKSDTQPEYDKLVMAHNNNSSTKNVLWVDATYYDYLSDVEILRGNTSWGKTGNYSEVDVETYNTYAADMFSLFNSRIHRLALTDDDWRYSLYFGNFWDHTEVPDDTNPLTNPSALLHTYYSDLNREDTTWEKFFAANNANGMSNMNQSVMGLVYPELGKNFYAESANEYFQELLVGNAGKTYAPYFDAKWLMGSISDKAGQSKEIKTEYKVINGTGLLFLAIPNEYTGIYISNNSISDVTKVTYLHLSHSFGKVLYTNNPTAWYSQDDVNLTPNFQGYDNKTYNVSGADDNYYYIVINNKISEWDANTGNWSNLYFALIHDDGVSKKYFSTYSSSKSINLNGEFEKIDETSYLYSSNRRGYVVQSQFPFRIEKDEKTKITHYQFNSAKGNNANSGDIVNFSGSGGSNYPDIFSQVEYYYDDATYAVPNMEFQDASGNGEYKQWGSETGYFPFNRKKGLGHNFGFGTKMEIKFKLPEGGKFSTENGQEEPAKFTFSGDDDVWVFVDGQLMLDLGGAHKQSKGEINFGAEENTVTGTSEDVAYAMSDVLRYAQSARLYEFVVDPAVIKDANGKNFSSDTQFVFFDNSSTAGKILSEPCTYSNISGGYYRLPSQSIQGNPVHTSIHDNISGNYATDFIDGKYHIYASGVKSDDDIGLMDCAMRIEGTGETILPQVKVISELLDSYNPSEDSTSLASPTQKVITANINNTDPSMVHTMTVYYLERGMGESNLSIDFTTIPATANVQVQKDIVTENLNPGLVTGMQTAQSEEEDDRDTFAFHVAPYDESSSENLLTDTAYGNIPFSRTDSLKASATESSAVGKASANSGLADLLEDNTANAFVLKDKQIADFLDDFKIGDTLTFGEAGGQELSNWQSRYRYETYFRLYKQNKGVVRPTDNSSVLLQAGGKASNANIKEFQASDGYYQYQFLQADGSANTSVSFSMDYDVSKDGVDASETVSRVLQYYNKVKTTDLLVSAEVINGENYTLDPEKSRAFAFKLECFIGGKWHALPLNATVFAYDKDGDPIANTSWATHLSDDGMFILSQHNKILIHGLPINLPYRVKEIRSNQFKTLGYFINNDYKTVTESGSDLITSVNKYLVKAADNMRYDEGDGGEYHTYMQSDDTALDYDQMTIMDGATGTSALLPGDTDGHYLCSTFTRQQGAFMLNPCYNGSGAEAEQVANPDEALSAYNGEETTAEALPNTVKRANSIQFVHTYEPAPGVLEVQKTVDGTPAEGPEYDGRFQFNAKLIDAYVGGSDVNDETALASYADLNFKPAVNDSDSIARFTGVSYTQAGSYLYEISEFDPGNDTQYTYSKTIYYAVVQVEDSSGTYKVTSVKYYKSAEGVTPGVDSNFNTGSKNWPCCGEKIVNDQNGNRPVFNNLKGVHQTNVSFTKTDTSKKPLSGAKFTLFTDEGCTDDHIGKSVKDAEKPGDVVSSSDASQFVNPVTSGDTQDNVTFADLDYKEGGTVEVGDIVAADVVIRSIPQGQTLKSISGVITYDSSQLQLDSRFAVGDSPDAAVYNGATVSIDSVEPDSGTLSYTVTFPDSGLTAADIGDGLIIARFTFTALSDIDTQASKAVVVDNAVQSATSFRTSEPGESLNVTGYGKSYVPTAYYFKETEAPAGYSPLTGTFRVLIYSDGKYTIQYCADPTAPDKKWEDTVDDILVKDASGAVSVMNSASAKPPFVGGTGTCLLRFAGWLALAVCAAGCAAMVVLAARSAKRR